MVTHNARSYPSPSMKLQKIARSEYCDHILTQRCHRRAPSHRMAGWLWLDPALCCVRCPLTRADQVLPLEPPSSTSLAARHRHKWDVNHVYVADISCSGSRHVHRLHPTHNTSIERSSYYIIIIVACQHGTEQCRPLRTANCIILAACNRIYINRAAVCSG